jgi:integrase
MRRLAVILLYTTGLRRGELLRLTLADYARDEHVLLIRETKFHKSRVVPLSPATARELLRPTFRNWFRPRYPYVYATFRCARSG